jgi:recombinational DNA repair ATPase RecF
MIIPTQSIHFYNWRMFENSKFNLPNSSFLVVGNNGSGKTSYLSGIYSILTFRSFPETVFGEMLRVGSDYFGIQTENSEWFLSAKKTTNGRLVSKYSKTSDDLPVVICYTPNDNQLLFLSRTAKIKAIDDLLIQYFGEQYEHYLNQLNKLIKGKLSLIKHIQEGGYYDLISAKDYTIKILKVSNQIWSMRCVFWSYVSNNFYKYQQWLNKDLKIDFNYFITNINCTKIIADIINFNQQTLTDQQIENIFNKELVAGKILYGASRDDFELLWDYRKIETIISRGEMRLLVLFLKAQVIELIKKERRRVIWLLDDVINEFDKEREYYLFIEILNQVDRYIITSTKENSQSILTYSLSDLLVNN